MDKKRSYNEKLKQKHATATSMKKYVLELANKYTSYRSSLITLNTIIVRVPFITIINVR